MPYIHVITYMVLIMFLFTLLKLKYRLISVDINTTKHDHISKA